MGKNDELRHIMQGLAKDAASRCYFYRFNEIAGVRRIKFRSQRMGMFRNEIIADVDWNTHEVTVVVHVGALDRRNRIERRKLNLHDPRFSDKLRDVLNDMGREIVEMEKDWAEKALEEAAKIKKKAKKAGVKKWK